MAGVDANLSHQLTVVLAFNDLPINVYVNCSREMS